MDPAAVYQIEPERAPRGSSSVLARPGFWLVAILALGALPVVRAVTGEPPSLPAVYAALPDFELLDEAGRPFTRERMRGRVWIADFVFSRCPTVCIRLSRRMAAMQPRLDRAAGDIRLVSFSVDPAFDTPEVLAAYGALYGARADRWSFVTGPSKQVEDVVVRGFRMGMDRDEDQPDDIWAITHGTRYVLIDRHARIRGYYDADDADEARLLRDAARVANLEPR